MKYNFDKLFFDKKVVFSMIYVIILIFVPALLQYYVHAVLPKTMIGTEGLLQMHTYLVRFKIASVIRIVLYIPASVTFVAIAVQSIRKHESIINIVAMLLILLSIVIVEEPKHSYVDVQGERFSDFPMIHAFKLLSAVEKDMNAEPVQLYSSVSLQVELNDFRAKRHRITEYSLVTENNILISQLSASDYNQLKAYVGEYTTHNVMCYPNSGLMYSLDNGETSQTNIQAEEEYYANQYTINYEEDGYLHWTPVGSNVSLIILVDGEQQIAWSANGESKYKPLFHEGHENVAYLEQWVNGKGHTRVSNVITVTNPYILETTDCIG